MLRCPFTLNFAAACDSDVSSVASQQEENVSLPSLCAFLFAFKVQIKVTSIFNFQISHINSLTVYLRQFHVPYH